MQFSDAYRTVSTRFDVLRGGVKYCELLARGDPVVRMIADAAIKTTLSGSFDVTPVGISDNQTPTVDFLTDAIRPCLILNGVEYPLGEYLAATVTTNHRAGVDYYDIEAYDYGLVLQQCTTETRVSFAANNKYTDIVQAMLLDAGIDSIICIESSAVLAATREDWEIGTPYIQIINDLLGEINYSSIWFDSDGNARIEPYVPPSAANIAHTYASGEYSIIKPDVVAVLDTYTAYNVFIAQVQSPDLPAPLTATSVNDDPDSPLSTLRRGRRIVAPIVRLDGIADQDTLQAYVDNLKFESIKSYEVLSFETAKAPVHGVNDVLALQHEAANGIYEESEWAITLGVTGQMTHKARRVMYT